MRNQVLEILAALEPGLTALQVGKRLREHLDPEEARSAAELYELRHRARAKLPMAERLLLTRKSLEQATDLRVARIRARRIADWVTSHDPKAWVLDATAGIGGDALALAETSIECLAVADASWETARMLRANVETVAGTRSVRILCQRAETWAAGPDLLVLDPDRRTDRSRPDERGGPGRTGDPERWSPPWSAVTALVGAARGACVKLAPAVDVDRLESELSPSLERQWQWVSLRGELKEVALWTGVLAGEPAGEAGRPRLQVLAVARDGKSVTYSGERTRVVALPYEEALRVRWIADPDPALVRSGLLGTVAREAGMRPLAAELAYLGGEAAPTSPLLQPYEVLGEAPLDRRRVRRLLAEHDIGDITVKKRGHSDDAATLARRLRGRGRRRGVLVVARLQGGHHAYLVRPPSGGRPAGRSE